MRSPVRIRVATAVNANGTECWNAKRRCRRTKECCLTHNTYRSDGEQALKVALRAAAVEASIPDVHFKHTINIPDPEDSGGEACVHGVALPEESAPADSQYNGATELAAQMVEEHTRAMKLYFEGKLGAKLHIEHPLAWRLVTHSAGKRTNARHSCDDRLTSYQRLHGHPASRRVPTICTPTFGTLSCSKLEATWLEPNCIKLP